MCIIGACDVQNIIGACRSNAFSIRPFWVQNVSPQKVHLGGILNSVGLIVDVNWVVRRKRNNVVRLRLYVRQKCNRFLVYCKYTSMCINLRSIYFQLFVLFGSNQPKFIDILHYLIYKIRVNSPLSLSKSTKILVWSRTYKIQGLLFFDYPQSLLSNIGF